MLIFQMGLDLQGTLVKVRLAYVRLTEVV